MSRTSSSSFETDSSSGTFATTPPTHLSVSSSLRDSPDPTYQKVQDGLPIPFFPASLDQPERNGPELPQYLPQLPNNATPTKVAEQVALEPSSRSVKLTSASARILTRQITGSIVYGQQFDGPSG